MKELKVAELGYRTIPTMLVFLALLFVVAVDGQTANGFVSIDCGQEKNYTDAATGLPYVSDSTFVDTGEIHKIPADMEKFASNEQGYRLRSFPRGTRNCYTLSVQRDKKYLLRASFLYANYDKLDRIPQFDLYLDVNRWISVYLNGSTSHHVEEILAFASRDSMFVCLVNTGSGTPFISSLELRPLDDDIYPLVNSTQSSVLFRRFNIQPIRDEILRYPNDSYDRMWMPYFSDNLETLSTESNIRRYSDNDKFKAPLDVLKTCGVAAANGSTINITLEWPPLVNITSRKISFVLHFAEIDDSLSPDQSRNYTLFSNLRGDTHGTYKYPGYLRSKYLISNVYNTLDDAFLSFALRKANGSTLPPILSAIEVYEVKELTEASTKEEEVDAIMNMKTFYKVKMNWQGDPCAPIVPWEGINCSNSSVVSLNLTSNGLSGKISVSFKDFKLLKYLDLSNNNLNGEIPFFLADLSELEVLNLSGNNLIGSIPKELQEKSSDGLLNMSLEGNPGLCPNPDQCTAGKSSSQTVIIIIVVVCSTIAVLAILFAVWKVKRGSKNSTSSRSESERRILDESRGGSLQVSPTIHSANKQFTYLELVTMTSNFKKIVGKGGFGNVYHGIHKNGSQVAVKILSNTSVQGSKEFQMEAQLLTRIHHKNLVSLVGYCTERDHLALVYEYMEGGSLKNHISDKGSNSTTICWRDRMRIALEAAQGLEYLHRGCQPAIVHRDVKTDNILLSRDFEVKIADFGLSKIFENDPNTCMSTIVMGTFGYIDPEYYGTQKLNEKSDVYSFGVVLLELITGQPAIINQAGERITIFQLVEPLLERGEIEKIVDPKLNGEYNTNSAWKALEIALACIPPTSIQRPLMFDVVKQLKDCLESEISQGSTQIESINIGYDSTTAPFAR